MWVVAMLRCVFVGVCLVVVSSPAFAGLPRGAQLSANEQSADEISGETRAIGDAELAIKDFGIVGRAALIVVSPKSNRISFRGDAVVSVRAETFSGDVVECSLDFDRCAVGPLLPVASPHQAAATRPEN